MSCTRRTVLASALALPALVQARAGAAHVVVVGGGFGGATTARYLRLRAPGVRVTLVEPAERFHTCPFSNLYLAGLRTWDSIGHGYAGLRAAGVEVVHARADRAEPEPLQPPPRNTQRRLSYPDPPGTLRWLVSRQA